MLSLRELRRDSTANASIFVALSALVLIGAAGVGSDTIQWTLLKRKLQRQANSAALAGAMSKMSGGSVSSAALAEIHRYTSITLHGSPIIENAPTTGAYAGDAKAVRVRVTANAELPFSQMFIGRGTTMTAESTAMAVGNGDFCVLALETSGATGITVTGNTTTTLGCGMATNSQGSSAIAVSGSGSVAATSLMAVGNIAVGGNGMVGNSVLVPYALTQADPFAGLPDPVVPGGCSASLSTQPNDNLQIANNGGTACYSSMSLKGTVNFAAGIYIIDGGSLTINANANISGSGVVFILTSSTASTSPGSIATMNINGNANINLTAPTSGTYAGVLFYQDRRAPLVNQSNDISGNSGSTLQGALYFPAQKLKFTGNSGLNINCLQVVARRVEFTGSSTVTNSCPSNSGTGSFSGYQVRLVD